MTSHDRTDRTLRDFLDWQADQLAGAPSAHEMTDRLAARVGRGRATRSRTALRLAIVLALTALLAVAIAAAIVISRPDERLRGGVDPGAILLGGLAYHPVTGATAPDPCDCDTDPTVSADGRLVVSVRDGTLVATDLAAGTERDLGACGGCGQPLDHISLAADGRTAAVVDAGQLRVLDTASGTRAVVPLPDGVGAQAPSLSPDGARIAFVRPEEPGIWLVDADGSDLVQAADDVGAVEPAWSPDGRSVAYVVDVTTAPGAFTYQLWSLDVASGVRRLLWESPGCCMTGWGGPAWSADSTQLAVVAGPAWTLWVVRATDGVAQRIATDVPAARPTWAAGVVVSGPAPSPSPGVPAPTSAPGAASGCAAVDLLAATDTLPWPAWGLDGAPADAAVTWEAMGPPGNGRAVTAVGPAGSSLAVAPIAILPGTDGVVVSVSLVDLERPLNDCTDLWLVDLDGRAARRVTASLGAQDVRDPHVSADGRAVAYLLDDRRGDGPQTTLHVVDLMGRAADAALADRTLGPAPCPPLDNVGSRLTAWSDDGAWLAFTCGTSMVLVDAATGASRAVPNGPGGPLAMTFDPSDRDGVPDLLIARLGDGVMVERLDAETGDRTTFGTWSDLDGQRIEWVEPWPPGAFSPTGDALFALGGPPGVLPGPSFGIALYRIDLITGAMTLVLDKDLGAETAHWTADGRLEVWQPEG